MPRFAGPRGRTNRIAPLLGAIALCIPVVHAANPAPPAEPAAAIDTGKTFDNWTVNCEQPKPESERQCFIFQNLVLKEGGQRVMHIAIGFPPEGGRPVALLTLPLGISLPPGASLQVGNQEPVRLQIERCEPGGCRAGLKLSDALVAQLKQNEEAYVTFHDGTRKPIRMTVSLRGFSAGLESLRALPVSRAED